MIEPKEEPLDDFSLMPTGNENPNQPAFLKEPKEEPLDLFLPYSVENEAIDHECKEEELDDYEKAPSQFDVNEFGDSHHNNTSFPSHSQDGTESLCGEELVMKKKEEKLRKKKEAIDAQRTSSRIVTRSKKFGDFLIDSDPLVNNSTSKVVKKKRIDESGDQPFHTTAESPKGQSVKDTSEKVEVENRRKSKRTVTKPMKYTDSLDYSDMPPKEENNFNDKTETCFDHTESMKNSEEIQLDMQNGNATLSDIENIENGGDSMDDDMNFENGDFDTTTDDLLDEENKTDEGIDRSIDISEDSSETFEVEKEGRPSRNISTFVKYDESSEESEGDDEPIVKKKRSKSVKNKEESLVTTPKCVKCEAYPSTMWGYVKHLEIHHKSTLIANGMYLVCSCSFEVSSHRSFKSHSKKCDGKQYTLHKLNEKVMPTPKCVICETYPSTVRGYIEHLHNHHNSTLTMNGVYLKCECNNYEVSSLCRSVLTHYKDCDGRRFSLHKLIERETPKNTPQCILCEKFPSTLGGYVQHLKHRHKSTLRANGIFLRCKCDFEVRSDYKHLVDHNKECNVRQFTLHKIGED